MALFDYELTVDLGLQESVQEVGRHGVEVNRAFGAADTLVYIPLMAATVAGLAMRRRWSLLTLAAVAGMSAYWSLTVGSMFLFLPAVPGYELAPGPLLWTFVLAYLVFGVVVLGYVIRKGEKLLR